MHLVAILGAVIVFAGAMGLSAILAALCFGEHVLTPLATIFVGVPLSVLAAGHSYRSTLRTEKNPPAAPGGE